MDEASKKHLLEENWQNDASLIEQRRNCRRCLTLCRVWQTRWHRARDVGAISAKGSQSGDRKNCKVKCRSTGRRPNKKPRARRSWIGRSVNCNQENVAEASVHRSLPLGAASIQPFLSNLLQRVHESSFHSSKGEPTADYGVQHQPALATAVHQVPGTRIHDLCGRHL